MVQFERRETWWRDDGRRVNDHYEGDAQAENETDQTIKFLRAATKKTSVTLAGRLSVSYCSCVVIQAIAAEPSNSVKGEVEVYV